MSAYFVNLEQQICPVKTLIKFQKKLRAPNFFIFFILKLVFKGRIFQNITEGSPPSSPRCRPHSGPVEIKVGCPS